VLEKFRFYKKNKSKTDLDIENLEIETIFSVKNFKVSYLKGFYGYALYNDMYIECYLNTYSSFYQIQIYLDRYTKGGPINDEIMTRYNWAQKPRLLHSFIFTIVSTQMKTILECELLPEKRRLKTAPLEHILLASKNADVFMYEEIVYIVKKISFHEKMRHKCEFNLKDAYESFEISTHGLNEAQRACIENLFNCDNEVKPKKVLNRIKAAGLPEPEKSNIRDYLKQLKKKGPTARLCSVCSNYHISRIRNYPVEHNFFHFYCCFDVETAYNKTIDHIVPYLICYEIHCTEHEQYEKLENRKGHNDVGKFEILYADMEETMSLILQQFNDMIDNIYSFIYDFARKNNFEDVEKLKHHFMTTSESMFCENFDSFADTGFRVILYGFNNYRFDNTFYFDDLAKHYNIRIKSRKNKVQEYSGTFVKGCSRFQFDIYDLHYFVPDKSLKEACIDNGVLDGKMDFNILLFNQYLESDDVFNLEASKFFSLIGVENRKPSMPEIIKNKAYLNSNKTYNAVAICLYYCERDVNATIKLFLKIDTMFNDLFEAFRTKFQFSFKYSTFFDYQSPTYISGTLLQQYMYSKKYKIMDFVFKKKRANKNVYNGNYLAHMLRTSLKGGLVLTSFYGEYISPRKDIQVYDVTAMYPLCMQAFFPVLEPDSILQNENVDISKYQELFDWCLEQRNNNWQAQNFYDLSMFRRFEQENFFFYCRIEKNPNKHELLFFSPLQQKIQFYDQERYSQCRNFFSNKYLDQGSLYLNNVEIMTLIFCGHRVIIKPHIANIVFLKTAQVFEPLITTLSELKEVYKTTNKSLSKLIKLLMNSLPGKLSQNFLHPKLTFDSIDALVVKTKDVKYHWGYIYGCQINAWAKWILIYTSYGLCEKFLKQKVSLIGLPFYYDTDSVFFDNHLLEPYSMRLEESVKLGKWNSEKMTFDVTWGRKYGEDRICRMVCVRKKVYFLLIENNKQELQVLSKTMKGLPRKEFAKITLDVIRDIYQKGRHIFVYSALFRKPFEFGTVKDNNFLMNFYIEKQTQKKVACEDLDNHAGEEIDISQIDNEIKQTNLVLSKAEVLHMIRNEDSEKKIYVLFIQF